MFNESPMNQSMKQSIAQPINQSIDQSVNLNHALHAVYSITQNQISGTERMGPVPTHHLDWVTAWNWDGPVRLWKGPVSLRGALDKCFSKKRW